MRRDNRRGVSLVKGDAGFDAAVLATSFNARDKGLRPSVLVQANDTADVVAAVQRARREGLKISICSGGHSWAQNHLRDGGLLLDMSRMDGLDIDVAQARAVIGPGLEGARPNRETQGRGLFFPTPHAPGVCMGGFLLQGGFGWNSRKLGLGCENVVGLDLVLADGSQVHASETENPDLFWAARGSGPGFFAVVVRYHLKLAKRPRAIGMVMQIFRMKHLEEVFTWADQVGDSVPASVEFQILMTPSALGIFSPGIEVIAPVLASSWKEAREAVSFVTRSPIRKKASIALPLLPLSIETMQKTAAKTHFPPDMHWCVDNMWTEAPMVDLLPGMRQIADTLPPAPSHVLWLNWQAPAQRTDMAFSVEAKHYLALYGEWKQAKDDALYANWATEHMTHMEGFSRGIQLADENLGRRPERFLADDHMARLDRIRAERDPEGLFQPWMGRVN